MLSVAGKTVTWTCRAELVPNVAKRPRCASNREPRKLQLTVRGDDFALFGGDSDLDLLEAKIRGKVRPGEVRAGKEAR